MDATDWYEDYDADDSWYEFCNYCDAESLIGEHFPVDGEHLYFCDDECWMSYLEDEGIEQSN